MLHSCCGHLAIGSYECMKLVMRTWLVKLETKNKLLLQSLLQSLFKVTLDVVRGVGAAYDFGGYCFAAEQVFQVGTDRAT